MEDFKPKQVFVEIDSNSSLFDLAEKINKEVGLGFDHCFEFNNSFNFLLPNLSSKVYDLFTDLYNEGEDVEPTNGESVKKTKIKNVWKEIGDKMNYLHDYGSTRFFCVELVNREG